MSKSKKVFKGLSLNVKKFLKSKVEAIQSIRTVKIQLLQGDKSPITVKTELTKDATLTEVSGTLAFRLIKLRQNAAEYKMNLGGFSFARKFDVRIAIDEVQTDGTTLLGHGEVVFSITLQNNEKSFNNFHKFIAKLTDDILTGESKIEGTFEDFTPELLKVA